MNKLGMIVIISTLFWIMLPLHPLRAAGPVELYRQAGGLYEAKDYSGTLAKYREIITKGVENANVYYNMGNAFFKNGELGKAILFYERALKYLPRDEDIQTNLKFARLLSVKREGGGERLSFTILFERFIHTFSVNEWTYAFEITYAVLFFFAIMRIFAGRQRVRKTAVRVLIAVLPIWFILGIFMGIKIHGADFRKIAVVIEKNIKVHSGPAESYTLLFSVPEGTKLSIHQQREEWFQVTLPNGYNGWVNSRSVGII